MLKALKAIGRCDIALVVLDAGEGITEQDTKVIGYTQEQGRALIVLINKWDLIEDDRKRHGAAAGGGAWRSISSCSRRCSRSSALTGRGIKRFRDRTATGSSTSAFPPPPLAAGRGVSPPRAALPPRPPAQVLLHRPAGHGPAPVRGGGQRSQGDPFLLPALPDQRLPRRPRPGPGAGAAVLPRAQRPQEVGAAARPAAYFQVVKGSAHRAALA